MFFTTSPTSSPGSSLYSSYSSYSISPAPSSDSKSQGSSCAYPSWPRRSSLDGSEAQEATSFISDDDLFPEVFDENDSDCTPIASPCRSPPRTTMEELEVVSFTAVRNMLALHKELQPEKKQEKEKELEFKLEKVKEWACEAYEPHTGGWGVRIEDFCFVYVSITMVSYIYVRMPLVQLQITNVIRT